MCVCVCVCVCERGVTGSFAITVLAFLHHKFWFIQFDEVSAEQITINTNNSKSITGVSNGVEMPICSAHLSLAPFCGSSCCSNRVSCFVWPLCMYYCHFAFISRRVSYSNIYLEMGTVRLLEQYSLYAIIISYSL
jgi:hypothetical protein